MTFEHEQAPKQETNAPVDRSFAPHTTLQEQELNFLNLFAKGIVSISIDMIEKAGSGHPGLPLGLARLGSYLYGSFLRHYPLAPTWIARDRCILSAGHGSAWLYSCLHLCGYDISKQEIENFRQKHSRTPGHPELSLSEGIETTSGPLGQGLAHAVGQALAIKMQSARLSENRVFSGNKVVAVTGDGCMMEGVQYEAMSLAGHLGLNNLVVCYDANEVCLDGPLDQCLSENVAARAIAQGWHVRYCDGRDFQSIHRAFEGLRQEQTAPVLIVVRSQIGEGAPSKAGTSAAHGAPLGANEAALTKKNWGVSSNTSFYIDPQLQECMTGKVATQESTYLAWQESFSHWRQAFPEKATLLEQMCTKQVDASVFTRTSPLGQHLISKAMASRESSSLVLQQLAQYPFFIGGSADLSSSDKTWIKASGFVNKADFSAHNIKFGVREFAMGAVASGLAQSGFLLPIVGTFLTFSDYMRAAVRLSAMMHLQVIYQFTHDSVLLGEDGPTHQPIEQIMSLRLIPGLQVLRPADPFETLYAFRAALEYNGPTALILSRQKLPNLGIAELDFAESTGRGAYVLKKFGHEDASTEVVFIATGSETALSVDTAALLLQSQESDLKCRVINMPSWHLFQDQDSIYKDKVFDSDAAKVLYVTVESGVTTGWEKIVLPYIASKRASIRGYLAIGVDHFGLSAPENDIRQELGLLPEVIVEKVNNKISRL